MKPYILFLLLFVLSFDATSQNDEKFVCSIYKDLIQNDCDSFLLITMKESIQITDYIKSELKKNIPKKAVKEICIAAKDTNTIWEWDTTKLNFVIPIDDNKKRIKERELIDDTNNAHQSFLTTYGLDTISDYNIADSLEQTILLSGINIYNFSKINSCYRQMYKFSRPLFTKNSKYAIIAFTNHKWRPNASGFIAVYENKNGTWIRIAEINKWVS